MSAVSDYRQSLQFQNLNEEKQNIQLEVCVLFHRWNIKTHFWIQNCLYIGKYLQVMRGGRTVKISIFDIVVGDVVPLRIGDQVST